jgi:ribonucleoside-diphosphate reductase alpha chain
MSEIMLPNDENHTFVCCLSSLNLLKFEEFKNTDTVYLATLFLDAVIEEFIQKAKNIKGIEDAVRFAEKSRALGLGVMGWHSFLQSKNLPFIGIASNSWTKIIFGHIKDEAERATKWLASEYGEPEWMQGTGQRNLTLTTIPPTRSSSKLAQNASQSIEPLNSNLYSDASAKGTMIMRNPFLEKLLVDKNKNSVEVWDSVSDYDGSVQHLDFLTKDEKDVFLTFREINQLELVKQASIRQHFICQGQSINLAFFQDASAKWINKVHITAWELGLKSLYYLKSQSKVRASNVDQRDLYTECLNCEG